MAGDKGPARGQAPALSVHDIKGGQWPAGQGPECWPGDTGYWQPETY